MDRRTGKDAPGHSEVMVDISILDVDMGKSPWSIYRRLINLGMLFHWNVAGPANFTPQKSILLLDWDQFDPY